MFTYFQYIVNDTQTISNNATININVTSVVDPLRIEIPNTFAHSIGIRGYKVNAINPNTIINVTLSSKIAPFMLSNYSGITIYSNHSNILNFSGTVKDVNNAILEINQIRAAYTTESDTITLKASGIGQYYFGGMLETQKSMNVKIKLGLPPTIYSIYPTYIYPNSNTQLTITGMDFEYGNFTCLFSHNVCF